MGWNLEQYIKRTSKLYIYRGQESRQEYIAYMGSRASPGGGARGMRTVTLFTPPRNFGPRTNNKDDRKLLGYWGSAPPPETKETKYWGVGTPLHRYGICIWCRRTESHDLRLVCAFNIRQSAELSAN